MQFTILYFVKELFDIKKLLIIVDYQNDFVNGSLGFDGAENLDKILSEKILKYRNENQEIIFTQDCHKENYLETQEGENLPVKHCIEGTDGIEIFGKTGSLKKESDLCFKKETFGSPDLFDYLRTKDYDEVELGGLVSNICVISNAVIAKTALPETKVIVDALATDSFDKELHKKTLDVLEGLQVTVLNKNI